MTICLDVESGAFGIQIVSGIRLSLQTTCAPSRQLAYTYALITRAGIQADRTFASSVSFLVLPQVSRARSTSRECPQRGR